MCSWGIEGCRVVIGGVWVGYGEMDVLYIYRA